MFLINEVACCVAIVTEGALFWYISRRSLKATWGDVRSGLLLSGARLVLMRLRQAPINPRNWRPHILVFTADVGRNIPMVEMAARFGQHRGIVTLVSLLIGDIDEHSNARDVAQRNQRLMDGHELNVFCEAVAVPELYQGMVTIAQANGFAGLDSNTVLLGWPEDDGEGLSSLLGTVRRLDGLGKCTLIYRASEATKKQKTPRILVWWKGREHNGDLMLLLAHLLKRSKGWEGSEILLKSVASDSESARMRQEEFASLLPDIRIDATVDVVVNDANEPVEEIIRRHSQLASLVFIGMTPPPIGDEESYSNTMQGLLDGLPNAILVRNAGPFRGRLV